ncbi:MAG: hypothetical protein H0W58_11000 [Acidobacteria bacterium]|jgi:hypothetical protein|nr:hypothetical protein [Acidobacteriota bacterium]
MKPLQHAQISQKNYGGKWQDYIEVHNFLDSSKATCAHFKHRFLLHHAEGIELGVRILGETLTNSENKIIETRRLLTDHLIEDVGRIVSVEDWARDLLPDENNSFYNLLAKKHRQIEGDEVTGENELFGVFNLSEKDRAAVKNFLAFPLENSTHPAALLISHNSFAVFLAERIFGSALVKDNASQKQLIAVREVFERVIFLRMKAVYSPAEIVARTASQEWMRGADTGKAQAKKKRLAND